MGPARWLALGSLLALGAQLEGRLVGEGDAGFSECDQFFYAGTPPEGLAAEGHVKICQRSAGTERFATLYSTQDRIPVYSAFRAPRPAPAGAEPRWLVEPQVREVDPQPRTGVASWGAWPPPCGVGPGKAAPTPSVPGAGNPGFGSTHCAPVGTAYFTPVNATAGARRYPSPRLSRRGRRWFSLRFAQTSAGLHSFPE